MLINLIPNKTAGFSIRNNPDI